MRVASSNSRFLPGAILVCTSFLAGCVSSPGSSGTRIASEIEQRAGLAAFPAQTTEPVIPHAVLLSDGLSEEEAVVLAISNNPEFQASVAALGIAEADVLRVRIPPNPSLSAVIGSPWEATLVAPIDFLLRLPGRTKAAGYTYDSQTQQVVQTGLNLILTTRLAYTDAVLARRRQEIADRAATRAERVNRITASAAQAGNATGLEARVTSSQAASSTQDAVLSRTARLTAENRLRRLTRLTESAWDGTLSATGTPAPTSVDTAFLIEYALEHRPDVKAARLDMEAAAVRIGLARTEALTLAAGVKLTGDGGDHQTRPAVNVAPPLFNRGQADRMAAEAQAKRVAFLYVAAREQATQEIRDAAIALEQASVAVHAWRETIVPELEQTVARSERAYAAGDIAYLVVLDNLQRLIDAQRAEAEANAAVERAIVSLARHVGGAMPNSSERKSDR